MSLLFVLAVLVGFGLWVAAAIPGSRVPEWVPRACFFVAALIWSIPTLSGV